MSRVTQESATAVRASHTGLSPSVMCLSRHFRSRSLSDIAVLQPLPCVATWQVWALPRSLATTRGIIIYFLFLQVLRCFSSLRSPPHIRVDDRPSGGRVVPFGNRRITGHLHLPDAYRSLSRPSSPPRAKASAVRPSILSRSVAALLRLRLILSAVFSVPAACCQAAGTAFCLYVLQSCLCQYVKDLL